MDQIVYAIKEKERRIDEIITSLNSTIQLFENTNYAPPHVSYNALFNNLDSEVNQLNRHKDSADRIFNASVSLNDKINNAYDKIEEAKRAMNKNKLKFGLQGELKNKFQMTPRRDLEEQLDRFDPHARKILTERMNEPQRPVETGGKRKRKNKTRKHRKTKR